MISYKLTIPLILKKRKYHRQANTPISKTPRENNVQVSIIGAASSLGSKLALKMKQNPNISKLKLYDLDEQVTKVAKDLGQLPGGPTVSCYYGGELKSAITMSNFILMIHNSNTPSAPKEEIARWNAPAVRDLCQAISERNPDAIIGITTKPINTIVPFACTLLNKYGTYNPFKVFGVTTIDEARAKTYAAEALRANPRHLTIPVIGGRSQETVVPLFSNILPNFYTIDKSTADKLTRRVKKADIYRDKQGLAPTNIALSWSINDCAEKVVDAIRGAEVLIHCYSANPGFGTRYFAGRVNFGPVGITRTLNDFSMSALECDLLTESMSYLNEDIALGEELANRYN